MSRLVDAPGRALDVLVVDDHPMFRAGFVTAWRMRRVHDRLVEADSVRQARELDDQLHPDVLVVDVVLPDGSGLDIAKRVTRRRDACVVILSSHDGPAVVEAARQIGVSAFLSKEMPVRDLFASISRLLECTDAGHFPDVAPLPRFSPRELQVLGGLMRGRSNPELAGELGLSPETIKTYVSNIYAGFAVQDRFGAVEEARRSGYDLALPHLGEFSGRST